MLAEGARWAPSASILAMQTVKLGRTGLEVSRLGLCTMAFGSPRWRPWALDEAASRPLLLRALEAGVTFFDTADMYSDGHSERVLGRVLRDAAHRDEVVVATKVFYPLREDGANREGLSRKRIFDSVEGSLRRLGTDYIDLYQIHRFDPDTPVEETLRALDDVVRAGKVRYVGASGMRAWQFAKLRYTAERLGLERPVAVQNAYNLIVRDDERELLPLCAEEGIGVLARSPLAGGFLAGDDGAGAPSSSDRRTPADGFHPATEYRESDVAVRDRLLEIAKARGEPPVRIALAWLLSRPCVTAPIVSADDLDRLEDALASVAIELDESECARLGEAYRPRPDPGLG